MQHVDEEKGTWQDNTRFLTPPRIACHQYDAVKQVDWAPGTGLKHRSNRYSWHQSIFRHLEPCYLWCRIRCYTDQLRTLLRSSYAKQTISMAMITLSLLYLLVLLMHSFHGQLNDPFEGAMQSGKATAGTQLAESYTDANILIEQSENSLLAYMDVHKHKVCKLVQEAYLIDGIRYDVVFLALRHSMQMEVMWQPHIANVSYQLFHRVWTSTTRTKVHKLQPWFCRKHWHPHNQSSMSMSLLDKIVVEYHTRYTVSASGTPAPTVQSGAWSKKQAHCIQKEFIRHNLLTLEQLEVYDYHCEELQN